jgi:PilZ domain-containing protein
MPGWIGDQDDARSPCIIIDMSHDGATLAVSEPLALPKNFRLYFSATAQTFRQCVVRERGQDSVGVQFEKHDPKNIWLV